jgi:Osmosensitive K+ channel histidine kinase
MNFLIKHKLAVLTAVYWVMLAYALAALLWWYIALNKQNVIVTGLRVELLNKKDAGYNAKLANIYRLKQRKTAQFIGEGSFFLALILTGAVFVYRATHKEFKLSQQQHNFMTAVTHELKTPIAVTQLNLETLLKRALDEEKQKSLLKNSIAETYRLNDLCNNILLASQFDAGVYHTHKQKICVSEVAKKVVKNYIIRFPLYKFESDIDENVSLLGEEILLQILLSNLIENAVKYSPKESTISVNLKKENDFVILKVADEGLGISDEEKKKIFQKFYRIGNENTRKAKGSGLGLYLCKEIVLQHKGRMVVDNNVPKGTIFTVTFSTI